MRHQKKPFSSFKTVEAYQTEITKCDCGLFYSVISLIFFLSVISIGFLV